MNNRRFTWMAGLGCVALMLILCLAVGGIVVWTNGVGDAFRASEQEPPLAVEATAQANDLPSQEGAYIFAVVENSPAAEAGLRGASREERVHGQAVPIGGDVVLALNGEPIQDFTALLTMVAFRQPGEIIELTVLRDGERQQVAVELAGRPASLGR